MNSIPRIKVNDWVPQQQPTCVGFRKKTDYYEQVCIKHPYNSSFHSRAELYHAMLLESDSSIDSYVPQPYKFRIGRRIYPPDCYLVEGHRRIIRELKPRGDFEPKWRKQFEDYLRLNRIEFEVVSNEMVLEQEILAENWLTIVRVLARGKYVDTERREKALIHEEMPVAGIEFGYFITSHTPTEIEINELTIFRLLHRGLLKADLTHCPLSFDTWIEPCS